MAMGGCEPGLSCDSVDSHKEWIKDIEAFQPDAPVQYPIAADTDRQMASQLNMLDYSDVGATKAPPPSPPTAAAAQAKEQGKKEQRGPLASRALHIIGPDKKVLFRTLDSDTCSESLPPRMLCPTDPTCLAGCTALGSVHAMLPYRTGSPVLLASWLIEEVLP